MSLSAHDGLLCLTTAHLALASALNPGAAPFQTAIRVLPAYRCILPSRLKVSPAGSPTESAPRNQRCIIIASGCLAGLSPCPPSSPSLGPLSHDTRSCSYSPSNARSHLPLSSAPPRRRAAEEALPAPHIDPSPSAFSSTDATPWQSALPARSSRPRGKYTSRLRPQSVPPISRWRFALLLAPALPRPASSLRYLWVAIGSLPLVTPTHLPETHLVRARSSQRRHNAVWRVVFPSLHPVSSSYSRDSACNITPPALHVLPFPPDLALV